LIAIEVQKIRKDNLFGRRSQIRQNRERFSDGGWYHTFLWKVNRSALQFPDPQIRTTAVKAFSSFLNFYNGKSLDYYTNKQKTYDKKMVSFREAHHEYQ
jgi:hypothetical protein